MSTFPKLLARPADFDAERWFANIAAALLSQCRLVVGEQPHRLVEVEIYYHGPGHEDPFAHRDPAQLQNGRWYFHRTGGVYRSGSFKGLDLAFGDGVAFGGVLFRGMETETGELVDGPSLLVDHLLSRSNRKTVRELDSEIGERVAWDAANPLRLEWLAKPTPREVIRTARVGLTLKKAKPGGTEPQYLMRAYRYLTEPKRTKKGKPHMVLGLHRNGKTADSIRKLTGCPPAAIVRYLADQETGRGEDVTSYFGKEFDTVAFCRLHGLLG